MFTSDSLSEGRRWLSFGMGMSSLISFARLPGLEWNCVPVRLESWEAL